MGAITGTAGAAGVDGATGRATEAALDVDDGGGLGDAATVRRPA